VLSGVTSNAHVLYKSS